MKVAKSLVVILSLALLLPIMAYAKDKDQTKVQVPERVQVGSTQLQPGTYKVEWTGTGDNVQVNFLRHNKTVATSQAKLIDHKHPSPYTDVVTEPGPHHQKQLIEIDMSNRTQALMLGPAQGTSSQGGQP
jgi:hypothetical protein